MQNEIFFGRKKKIVYWEHNPEKKQTIILVHGFTGSHDGFQYLVPLLNDYHLIVPDLPGFGISPLPHNRQTLVELGASINALTTLLDTHDKPVLLGHSMGSLVVAEALKQDSSLYSSKVILASPVPKAIKWLDKRKAGALASGLYYTLSHHLPVGGKRLARSKIITRLSTAAIITTKDKKLRRKIYEHHFDNLNHISDISWYDFLYKDINRTGVADFSKSLKPLNVLVISGSKDAVVPLKYQLAMTDKIKANIEIIPDVGHLAHYEKPTELATTIADFLG